MQNLFNNFVKNRHFKLKIESSARNSSIRGTTILYIVIETQAPF